MLKTAELDQIAVRAIKRRYYLLWWAYSLAGAFVYGIYPLFLRARGLNQLQANTVLALYFVLGFLTDILTGAIADTLGRRRAFTIACAIRACAYALYFRARGWPGCILAEAVDALGTTLGNGSIDAWAVDSLDAAGLGSGKQRLFSRAAQFANLGFLAAALVGAYVGYVDLAWPWILGAASFSATTAIAATLMHDDQPERPRPGVRALTVEVWSRVRRAVHEGFANRAVIVLTAAGAIEFAAMAPYWMLWPQYVTDRMGYRVWALGWLFCLFAVGRLVGAEISGWLALSYSQRASMLAVFAAGCGVTLIAAGLLGGFPMVTIALLLVMNLCVGALDPARQNWINEHIVADHRAALLSFQSTFGTLGGAIGLLLGGIVTDRSGLLTTWQLCGLIWLAAVPCFWALRDQTVSVGAQGPTAGELGASG